MELLRTAADKSHWASFLLGRVYLFGSKDVKRSREQAVIWLTKALNDGSPCAEGMLQNMEQYEHQMLADTALYLFFSLSRIIEKEYAKNQKNLHSQTDSKLRRIIQQKKKELGIKEDTGQQQSY